MFTLCRQLSVAMKKTSGGQMEKHHLAALFMDAKQGENPSGGVFAVSLGETLAVRLRLKGGQAQLEHLAVAHSFPRLWAQWCMCISAVLHVPRKRRAGFIAQWNVPHS